MKKTIKIELKVEEAKCLKKQIKVVLDNVEMTTDEIIISENVRDKLSDALLEFRGISDE